MRPGAATSGTATAIDAAVPPRRDSPGQFEADVECTRERLFEELYRSYASRAPRSKRNPAIPNPEE